MNFIIENNIIEEQVRVSICCLTFNHGNYIRDCLDGFVMQKTNFAFEVLLHDDASTDNTADVIKEYEEKYPNIIKPIYQNENQYSKGVGVTRKFNFPRVKGEYIALCEGDDYWIDEFKLQKQVEFLDQNKQYGGVSSNNRWFFENENKVEDSILDQGVITFEQLCASNKINSQTALFTYDLLPNLDWMNGLKIGDWALHLSITSQLPYYRLRDITTLYRVHTGGVHSLLPEEQKIRNKIDVLIAVLDNLNLSYDRKVLLRASIESLLKKLIAFHPEDIKALREKYFQYGGSFFNKTLLKSYLK